jgi:hypothetical protein
MKGLGLKLLKIHLLFLAFLNLFIDKTPNPNPEVKQGRTLFWFKCAPDTGQTNKYRSNFILF